MTGDRLKYKYINENSPTEKIDYSYSKFYGEDFICAWIKSRENFIMKENTKNLQLNKIEDKPTKRLFLNWIQEISDSHFNDKNKLNLLVKRFEVTKKIYDSYNSELRPINKDTDYKNIDFYILFSYVLVSAYKAFKELYYLNSLLKVNDITISNFGVISEDIKSLFNHCIKKEIEFINDLRIELK